MGQDWFLPLHRGKSTIIPARECTNSPCRNGSQTSFDRAGLKFWRELVKWGPQRVPVGERLVGEGNLKTGFPLCLIITRCVFEKTAVTRLRELWCVRRCVSVHPCRTLDWRQLSLWTKKFGRILYETNQSGHRRCRQLREFPCPGTGILQGTEQGSVCRPHACPDR